MKWILALLSLILVSTSVFGQEVIVGRRRSAAFTTCGAASGYTNTFTITLSTQAGLSADLTNWPILFRGNAIFKTTGNGGDSLSTGTDVVFCSTNDNLGTILTSEFVPNSYSATAGTAEWWIKVPTISHTTTTKIYGLVGKSSATDRNCNAAGAACGTTLFPGCLKVYHMGGYDGTTGTLTRTDSCLGSSATNHSSTGSNSASTFPPVQEYTVFAATQYVDSGATISIPSFTYEALLGNLDSSTDHQIMGNVSLAAGNPGAWVRTKTGGADCPSGVCVQIAISAGSTGSKTSDTSDNFGNGGVFHQWVATYATGALGVPKIYIDGVSKTVNNVASSGTPGDPAASTANFAYGNCSSVCTANWAGQLDEIRITNTVLTADQIAFDNITMSTPTSVYTVSTP